MTKQLGFFTLAACLACVQVHAATVFSADFEGGSVAADVGTLSFTGPGSQSIASVNDTATHTDWGNNALWADRSASNGTAEGFRMQWNLTDTVSLDGATIDFEHIIRRTNTPNVKSHIVNGYDSNGATLFSIILIDRIDGGLANIADYLDNGTDTDERQRQTVAYVDATNGNSLFAQAQLASGLVPDSNDRSGGGNSFGTNLFFGNNGDPAVNDQEAGLFSITLSNTGWTLTGTPNFDSVHSAFTTVEIPFLDGAVQDLAQVEVIGETVQAGGYWDNLSVTGDVVAIPEPTSALLILAGSSALAFTGRRRG